MAFLMRTAILLPTIYRPSGLLRVLDSIFYTVQNHVLEESDKTEIVIACEDDDKEVWIWSPDINIAVCKEKMKGPAYAWNTALQWLEDRNKTYDLYVLASDDIEFLSGWLEQVIKVQQETNRGLIGLNDNSGKYERAGFCTHYAMTREFIKKYNGGVVACPHYSADFTDREIIDRADLVDQFAYAKEANIIHYHRKQDDLGYKKADDQRQAMRELYLKRKRDNFPNDYPAIIK